MQMQKTKTPRAYQTEIFERAKQENVIAFLPTGSGKTLVAILLMQHHLEQHKLQAKIFFLVPTVPLVEQQANAIQTGLATSVQICKLFGDQSNMSKVVEMKNRFLQAQIYVMTPDVLKDSLSRGYITMDSITLLIFDECHRCMEQAPYNVIMKTFYFSCAKKPKIMGLTACPAETDGIYLNWYFIFFVEGKRVLEKNMDSTIVYLQTTKKHLSEVVPPIDEIEVPYKFEDDAFPLDNMNDPAFIPIQQLLKTKEDISTCKKMIQELKSCYENLGYVAVLKMFQRLSQTNKEMYMVMFKEVVPCLNEKRPYTSKMLKLIEHLQSFQRTDLILIFVKRRSHAYVLADVIKLLRQTWLPNIVCEAIVGQDKTDTILTDAVMNAMTQEKLLRKFRNSEINCLVTTSVLEEGVDIQPCNAVIRFDMYDNFISYVQSRGRARSANSKYIIFYNIKVQMESNLINKRKIFEKRISNEHKKMILPDSDDLDTFEIATTQAKTTKQLSISQLYHFCAQVQHDEYQDTEPKFSFESMGDSHFKCYVSLPYDIRAEPIESIVCSSKHEAKSDACFQAVKWLHEKGYMDDHFLNKLRQELEALKIHRQTQDIAPIVESSRVLNILRSSTSTSSSSKPFFYGMYIDDTEPLGIMLYIDLGAHFEFTTQRIIKDTQNKQEFSTVVLKQLQVPEEYEMQMLDECKSFTTMVSKLFPFALKFEMNASHFLFFSMNTMTKSADIPVQDYVITTYNEKPYLLIAKASQVFASTEFPKFNARRKQSANYDTYGEYFARRYTLQVKPDQCFLVAKIFGAPDHVHLPQEHCRHIQVSLLPQHILYIRKFKRILVDLAKQCSLCELMHSMGLNPKYAHGAHMKLAITAKSCDNKYNYERLEFLGDALLKTSTSLYLYDTYPKEAEVYLTLNKIQMVRNSTLYCMMKNFSSYICTISYKTIFQVVRGISVPAYQTEQALSMKRVADLFESLLGALFIDFGYEAARQFLSLTYKLSFPSLGQTEPVQPVEPKRTTPLRPIEQQLKYEFQNEQIMKTCFVHPSMSNMKSYQRYEFLGDALMDWCVTLHLYTHYPGSSPGMMTTYRSAAVNNETLAKQSVQYGLQHELRHNSTELFEHVMQFVSDVKSNEEDTDAPKPMADMYEALVAGVYLDSGRDLQSTINAFTFEDTICKNMDEHPKSLMFIWLSRRNIDHKKVFVVEKPSNNDHLYTVKISVPEYQIDMNERHRNREVAEKKLGRRFMAFVKPMEQQVEAK